MNTQQEGVVAVGVAESMLEGGVLRWAAEQAQLDGRPLTLLHASGPVSGAWAEHAMDPSPRSSQTLRRHGMELLDRARSAVEQIAPGLEVHQRFAVADPATLLLEAATQADLLVLGSRGRGPVRSHLLGSVGVSVVRHALCPVVVHRPGDHPGRVHRGVLVGADASEESRPVLEFAFRLAAVRRLPLRVVHFVYDVRSVFVGVPMVADLREDVDEHRRRLSESLAGLREEYPDVFVTVDTLRGLPERELAELSSRADVTVMGSHRRSLLGRALAGSVSETVLEHACGALAFVPEAG